MPSKIELKTKEPLVFTLKPASKQTLAEFIKRIRNYLELKPKRLAGWVAGWCLEACVIIIQQAEELKKLRQQIAKEYE